MYEGQFFGNGILVQNNKNVYIGGFINNLPNGEGSYFFKDKQILVQGYFFDGELLEGYFRIYQSQNMYYEYIKKIFVVSIP